MSTAAQLARPLAPTLAALLLAGAAGASEVLIIPDRYGSGVDALAQSLASRGIGVTVCPMTEDLYDGMSPALLGFDAVIHLDGDTLDQDMPVEGQLALVDYVQQGGRFIHGEWNAYELAMGRMQYMRDLTVFDGYDQSPSFVALQVSPAPGQEDSQLLTGLPLPLSFFGRFDHVSLHDFADQPAQAVMLDAEGGPAVAWRAYGAGTVVGFHFAAYGGDAVTLGDANVQQLYANAVLWQPAAMDPVLTLAGPERMFVEYGAAFADPGATAVDPIDGDLSSLITVSGAVDTGTLGSYVLTYSVTDQHGHTASASRVVVVVDTTPPVMSLNGAADLAWPQGTAYQDPGCSATDLHDGDLSRAIAVSGTVDAGTPGSYALSYTVSDASGNRASIGRTVTVYAAPSVTCSVQLATLDSSGGFSDVGLAWHASSLRPIVHVSCSVTQDEKLSGKGAQGFDAMLSLTGAGFPDRLSLRDDRQAAQDGRVYLVVITATDDLGLSGSAMCTVVVPKNPSKKSLSDVQGQAQADLQAGALLPVDSFGMPTSNG